jgi:hypothetical protein
LRYICDIVKVSNYRVRMLSVLGETFKLETFLFSGERSHVRDFSLSTRLGRDGLCEVKTKLHDARMLQIPALFRVNRTIAYKEMLLFVPSYDSMLIDYSLTPPPPYICRPFSSRTYG